MKKRMAPRVLPPSPLTMLVATDLGKRTGKTVKVAVTNMADPTPSVILSKTQYSTKTQLEGSSSTNLEKKLRKGRQSSPEEKNGAVNCAH